MFHQNNNPDQETQHQQISSPIEVREVEIGSDAVNSFDLEMHGHNNDNIQIIPNEEVQNLHHTLIQDNAEESFASDTDEFMVEQRIIKRLSRNSIHLAQKNTSQS